MSGALGVLLLHRVPQGNSGAPYYQRRFARTTLLNWVARRMTESLQLDQVAVLADRESAEAIRFGLPADVGILVGEGADPLGRLAHAVADQSCQSVVLVGMDTPFIDPALIDRIVASSRDGGADYISGCHYDGRPVMMSQLGVMAEWCTVAALRQADAEARSSTDRHDVTRYIISHPEKFRVRLVPVPRALDDDQLCLTLRCEDDWDVARTIAEALDSVDMDWQSIAQLLDRSPDLRFPLAEWNSTASAREPGAVRGTGREDERTASDRGRVTPINLGK